MMTTPPNRQPLRLLSGVRVLDLGRLMPSAIATFELAKLGADVVKVEMPPHGDYFRATPPLIRGRGDMHLDVNRAKRSICLDFRTDSGRATLLRMAARADVFLEVSRPGAMAAMRLGYDDVRAINPAIVYCSISGFGQEGPYSALPAHGLSADCSAGLLDDFDADGRHRIAANHISVGPRAAGLHAAIALLGALLHQRATGEGQFIDVSQADAALAWNYRNLDSAANGLPPMPAYDALGPRHAFYRTADDEWVLFAATERKFWETFCDGVGRPDLKDRGAGDLVSYAEDDVIRAALVDIMATRTRDAWVAFGVGTGVPISPVVRQDELPSDPHVQARGMLRSEPHPLGGQVALSGHPVKFSGGEAVFGPAPEMGADSAAILRDYGFTAGDIDRLLAEHTVLPGRAPQRPERPEAVR